MKKQSLNSVSSIFHEVCFLASLCIGTLCPAHAISSDISPDAIQQLDLIEFVSRTLVQSDQALDIQDSLVSAQLDTATAAQDFKTELVPLANIGSSANTGTLGMGLEARRNNQFGTGITVGLVGEKITSNQFTVDNSHSTRAFVRLSQGLFRRWGHEYNRFGLTVAELEQQRANLSAHSTRQDLILSAVQAYYQVVLNKQLVLKSAQALTRRQEHLEAARSRQSAGLVSMADVYRAELALLDMETSLKDQQRAYSSSIEELYEFLAIEKTRTLVLGEDVTQITPTIMDDWDQQVLQYRPDWRAHVIDRQITNLSRSKAERDLLPDLSLNVLYEQQGLGSDFEEAKDLDDSNWSVQLQLNSTLGRAQEKTALQKEKLRGRRLLREGQALKRRIHRDANQAFEDLKAGDRRHSLSKERLIHAQKGLELSKLRYSRGLSGNLEVLDSELAFTNAELDVFRTLIDYNLAAVRLAHGLGILDIEWLKLSLEPLGSDKTASDGNTPG